MKTLSLTSAFLLLTVGAAFAQQPATPTKPSLPITSTTDERVAPASGPVDPTMTDADAARERARLANAAQLRKQETTPPALISTIPPAPPRHPASGEPINEPELEARERARREQAAQMMREALPAKQRKQLATAAPAPSADKATKAKRRK